MIPQCQSNSQSPTRIAGGRLDPNIFKGALAQNAAIADAIERHPASHAQILEPGLLMDRAGDAQHDLLGDDLARARDIHLALRQRGLGLPRRPPE